MGQGGGEGGQPYQVCRYMREPGFEKCQHDEIWVCRKDSSLAGTDFQCPSCSWAFQHLFQLIG